MIAILSLATLAFLFFAFLAFQVWRRYQQPGKRAELAAGDRGSIGSEHLNPSAAGLIPVDLEAFENLTDPEEEKFLRTHLEPSEFRVVQRLRIRAAKMYVVALSANASVLMACGQAAGENADPETAAAGQEIMQRAGRVKVWCLLSLMRLNAALVFPMLLSPDGAIAGQYLVVTSMAANLPRDLAA